MIGIKVADGAFFPVLMEDTVARKRLVLTTAHDAQTNVQIDFYRAFSASMHNASYLGTLLLENIQGKKEGEPSIELLISLDANGEFSASAHDLDRPEDKNNHILTVSLARHEGLDDIDFDQEYAILKEDAPDKYAATVKTSKAEFLKPAIIVISVMVLIAAFCIWFFLLRPPSAEKGGATAEFPPEIPLAETPPPYPVAEQTEIFPPLATDAEQETLIIQAPDVPSTANIPSPRKRPLAPVSSYKVPSVIPAGGIQYKLRWGDTLWDVSQAFYRTPWRYKYLANYNGIRNPDRIIAGRTVRIPPLPK
ncbi:MAG: LysM peptidoglycan-binding domain-containing protein [Spirochaetaceae bacterium]|nr:LysM peptidoglycan-binding domain-containing protein [Spirochaetaceae bacterium]